MFSQMMPRQRSEQHSTTVVVSFAVIWLRCVMLGCHTLSEALGDGSTSHNTTRCHYYNVNPRDFGLRPHKRPKRIPGRTIDWTKSHYPLPRQVFT